MAIQNGFITPAFDVNIALPVIKKCYSLGYLKFKVNGVVVAAAGACDVPVGGVTPIHPGDQLVFEFQFMYRKWIDNVEQASGPLCDFACNLLFDGTIVTSGVLGSKDSGGVASLSYICPNIVGNHSFLISVPAAQYDVDFCMGISGSC